MVDQILATLGALANVGQDRVCFVYGAGCHPRSTYTEMIDWANIHVVHFESVLPHPLRFIPSYRGLIKVDDLVALPRVFKKLMEQATVTAFIFDAALEETFVDSVRSLDNHRDHSFGVKEDPGYILYLVDADRDDSPTGMVQFLSYGATAPGQEMLNDIAEG
jgi:hypothetical protein